MKGIILLFITPASTEKYAKKLSINGIRLWKGHLNFKLHPSSIDISEKYQSAYGNKPTLLEWRRQTGYESNKARPILPCWAPYVCSWKYCTIKINSSVTHHAGAWRDEFCNLVTRHGGSWRISFSSRQVENFGSGGLGAISLNCGHFPLNLLPIFKVFGFKSWFRASLTWV
jgi:hypothetical protein